MTANQSSDRSKVVSPSDPQISPDGKSIAFLVTRANMKDNRYDSDLQLYDLATGTQRPLTFERRGVTQPRWSPDLNERGPLRFTVPALYVEGVKI